MRKFDYHFLQKEPLPSSFFSLAFQIGKHQERLFERLENYPKLFGHLEKRARMESIKASNAIENIFIEDQRLIELSEFSSRPQTEPEKLVAGYRDALDAIVQNYRAMALDEKTLLLLHQMLYRYADHPEKEEAGSYKSQDNAIVSLYADGSMEIIFKPVSAKETPKAIRQWLQACKKMQNQKKISPLLWIPCVILDFLCIHPFLDGNGRISRLLTLLLLLQNGYDIVMAISFENEIYKRQAGYYQALQKADQGWDENHNDYTIFIAHFLTTLLACYSSLEKHTASPERGKAEDKKRIETAICKYFSYQSFSQIQSLLPDIPVQEIEAVLESLLQEGKIEQVEFEKEIYYTEKSRLNRIKREIYRSR